MQATKITKAIKSAVVGGMCLLMLAGCSSQENYDNTAATHTPEPTEAATHNTAGDDVGNIADDAGNIVEDAGDAVGDAAKDVGDAVR